MTTARQIITDALTFGLNRLSAGEALDADLAGLCLSGLNSLVDEINGDGGRLWKKVATTETVSGASEPLATWGLPPGAVISLVTHAESGLDTPIDPTTYDAYQSIPDKSISGGPTIWASDGLSLWFYPTPAALDITVICNAEVSQFEDIDTDYTMPNGWRSGLADMLAERVAFPVIGDVPAGVARNAATARRRLVAKVEPAILNPGSGSGYRIFEG